MRYDPWCEIEMVRVLRQLVMTGLLVATGCGPPSLAASEADRTPPSAAQLESDRAPAAHSTSVPTEAAIEADGEEPESRESHEVRTTPLFVEVTHTTSMTRAWYPSPPLQVGSGAFLYQADTRTLLVYAAHEWSPHATDVLIGVISILEMPGQTFESRELFQFPGAQPDNLQIASLDRATGRIELRYLGQLRVLAPGESLTFKPPGAGSDSSSTVTTIVSHGRLEELRTLPPDGPVP